VLPLNDLTVLDLVTGGLLYHEPVAPSGHYTYYPGTSAIPEQTAANTHGVSWTMHADLDLTAQPEGVIFAHGSRFADHALFIKDGQLYYVYNFLGIPPEQRLTAPAPAPGRHQISVAFAKESIGEHREAHGTATLAIDGQTATQAPIRTCLRFSLTGEGLCIGYDDGDAVSALYQPQFEFTGGTIHTVTFDIGTDLHLDREQHMKAAIVRD
jgi:hypothetical protein